ncbi:transmembrane protein 104 isoform X1 [Canis lupus dingo]|uniref:Transmembrane protein 104 n=3 Tax=Canis lupus TaxID=9612 RepID=A0A8C0Q385_CANLF|nr:transmembrane protein 104 isoform X1 [Canis lupus dingo]XP_048969878.1 transmembrane protein 104 isoform X1 [Canis lupus dingo]|eukprot:XP_022278445.1 transmembrane protein 104 isoform X1 [Canis lupus familiaris]
MAGEITETGELYSPYVGLVYMFNLIVGTGALTMPKAFATAGWLVSLVLLVFLGFMSFVTTTFVVEAMAAANAQLRWKRMENHQEEEDDDSSTASDSDVLVQDNYERAEKRPILSVQRRGSLNLFEITDRVEMGQMACMFFNKAAPLATSPAVWRPTPSTTTLTPAGGPCAVWTPTASTWWTDAAGSPAAQQALAKQSRERRWHNGAHPCWRLGYKPMAVFTLLLGPFTFFDVQKTKYLQILTSLMRWVAFAIMIVLALVRIGHGHREGHPPLADLSGVRNLFGVCVYSFMCQHSLPSLITPVSSKRHLTRLVFLDYVLILSFYGLLCFTAIFCFRGDSLMDMYTLNFARCDVVSVAAVRFFLGLFPVFTISTNFPIIAVTLRNNWKTLFHREGGTYPWVVDRVVFPTITLLPPVLVAFCTHDLESLVGITGAYAGTGIQYVIPAFLVYHCRKDTQLTLGYGTVNKHRSPFRHTFWVGFVLLWAFSCFFFVTANIVLSETKV